MKDYSAIFFLGNREIKVIDEDTKKLLKEKGFKIGDNEGKNTIILKDVLQSKKLLDMLIENENFIRKIDLVLIPYYLDYLKNRKLLDKTQIFLFYSNQTEIVGEDYKYKEGDTFLTKEIVSILLKEKYNIKDVEGIEIKNLNDFYSTFEKLLDFMNKSNFKKISLFIKGGVPQYKIASYLISSFFSNVEVIDLVGREKRTVKNMSSKFKNEYAKFLIDKDFVSALQIIRNTNENKYLQKLAEFLIKRIFLEDFDLNNYFKVVKNFNRKDLEDLSKLDKGKEYKIKELIKLFFFYFDNGFYQNAVLCWNNIKDLLFDEKFKLREIIKKFERYKEEFKESNNYLVKDNESLIIKNDYDFYKNYYVASAFIDYLRRKGFEDNNLILLSLFSCYEEKNNKRILCKNLQKLIELRNKYAHNYKKFSKEDRELLGKEKERLIKVWKLLFKEDFYNVFEDYKQKIKEKLSEN